MSAEPTTDLQDYAAVASVYERTRPSYPAGLVDALLAHAGVRDGDQVAEIGAGTGHFTRTLTAHRLQIAALEPVVEMRAQAPPLDGVRWSDGTFESTGLADHSQCWVVSAQAFHWARRDETLPEIRRILKPQAWFSVLWNAHHIAREPVLMHTYALLRRYVPAYRYVDRTTPQRRWSARLVTALPATAQGCLARLSALVGRRDLAGRGLEVLSTGDFDLLAYHEVEHVVPVDRDSYVDLWRTRNHLGAIAGREAFDAFLSDLSEYLARERIDRVAVPYVCGAWSARARSEPSGRA